jgi:8-amino-7-oxononanoate synthase
MNSFQAHLSRSLETIHEQHLFRKLRKIQSPQTVALELSGQSLIGFASNDYLGLANHPLVKEAAKSAINDYGAGAGASRLVTGSLPPHEQLEEKLAAFKGTEAAIAFTSGYQTAIGVLSSLLDKNDTVFSDRLNHACLIDGLRLSKARVEIFEHNDVDHLKLLLQKATDRLPNSKKDQGNRLIVTESVFSMDGDQAPLAAIARLKQEFGAWLMVDEAHATGLYGANRKGLAEQAEVSDQIDIHMGTLGKALGSSGGFICGSLALREFLINRARSFIFSTAAVPAAAAAASAAIDILQGKEGEDRVRSLWERVRQLQNGLNTDNPILSPIIPYIIGSEEQSLTFSERLQINGLLVPAIRYPSVPRGQARLRITLSSDHSQEQVTKLIDTIHDIESAA